MIIILFPWTSATRRIHSLSGRILNKIKTIKIIQKAGYSEQGWNSEMGSNIFMIKKIEDNYFLIFDFVTIFIDKLCCYRELVEC